MNSDKPKVNEVWRNNETRRVFVVRSDKKVKQIEQGDYSRIADFAHQNDDFSYFCGNEFCRCMQ